jgi:hypothetical protein
MSMILSSAWQYADPVSPDARRTRTEQNCTLRLYAGRTNERDDLALIDPGGVLEPWFVAAMEMRRPAGSSMRIQYSDAASLEAVRLPL